MQKADYSLASPEERENVISILQRNVNEMIEQKKVKNPTAFRHLADRLCSRIRNGDVISGGDFQKLLRIFQKRAV